MFNKEKNNNVQRVLFHHLNLKQYGDYLISNNFTLMIKYRRENQLMDEQMDYENKKTDYINREYNYARKNQYNQKIVDLYNSGRIIINNESYILSRLYITYNEKSDFQLIDIDNGKNLLNNKEITYNYNGAIKFIDTTAFTNLIKHKDIIINNNTIIIKNIKTLLLIINNWDGLINDITSKTDAVKKKNILRRENEG